MSFIVFGITSFVPHPLPVSPAFIQVSGTCPGAANLVAITLGDSHSNNTSGAISVGSQIGAIFAATSSYTQLRDCLNQMGTGTVQLTITHTLTNGSMKVTGISSQVAAALTG